MKQILFAWMGNSPMSNVRRKIAGKACEHPSFNNICQRINVKREVKLTHRMISRNIKFRLSNDKN